MPAQGSSLWLKDSVRVGKLSHLGPESEAQMVSVEPKSPSMRTAKVKGSVYLGTPAPSDFDNPESLSTIIQTARLGGIQAAKKTAELIIFCHPLSLDWVDVEITWNRPAACFEIVAKSKVYAKTGVEMEALTAALIAGATLYDMIKGLCPAATVGPFLLVEKKGGSKGPWTRPE